MLDQADFIARYDKQDALGVVAGYPDQLRHRYQTPGGLREIKRFSQIVCAGMGGSALAAEFVKNWTSDRLIAPLEIVRDYELPKYVREDTLVVFSSYSGNTEETVVALDQALERGAMAVVMAAGGKMLEVAKTKNLPYFGMPKVPLPRLAMFYGVRAWAQLFEGMDLLSGLVNDLEQAAEWVSGEMGAWQPGRATEGNDAKQIAGELVGHPVVVYAGTGLTAAALKWKMAINENAKNLASWNVLPDMNHNELSGWDKPERSGLKVVELRSSLEHPRVTKRFKIMNRLRSNVFAPIEVDVAGKSKLEQLVWSSVLGEYVSVYLGILNQVDPMAGEVVDKLKSQMG